MNQHTTNQKQQHQYGEEALTPSLRDSRLEIAEEGPHCGCGSETVAVEMQSRYDSTRGGWGHAVNVVGRKHMWVEKVVEGMGKVQHMQDNGREGKMVWQHDSRRWRLERGNIGQETGWVISD